MIQTNKGIPVKTFENNKVLTFLCGLVGVYLFLYLMKVMIDYKDSLEFWFLFPTSTILVVLELASMFMLIAPIVLLVDGE